MRAFLSKTMNKFNMRIKFKKKIISKENKIFNPPLNNLIQIASMKIILVQLQ